MGGCLLACGSGPWPCARCVPGCRWVSREHVRQALAESDSADSPYRGDCPSHARQTLNDTDGVTPPEWHCCQLQTLKSMPPADVPRWFRSPSAHGCLPRLPAAAGGKSQGSLDWFIPPSWAIAHHLIKAWADKPGPWFAKL